MVLVGLVVLGVVLRTWRAALLLGEGTWCAVVIGRYQ